MTEDEGFEDASDGLSTSSTFSDDSGTHGLEIWDEALKSKPSRFFTWEGRKQMYVLYKHLLCWLKLQYLKVFHFKLIYALHSAETDFDSTLNFHYPS